MRYATSVYPVEFPSLSLPNIIGFGDKPVKTGIFQPNRGYQNRPVSMGRDEWYAKFEKGLSIKYRNDTSLQSKGGKNMFRTLKGDLHLARKHTCFRVCQGKDVFSHTWR
ncbi:hypothetical protein AVEN_224096-1 [Araneus ventricosus]|uniref:Uncharacterized protein n=1 Tax=Araneus ventricosus TaxID=182803 RepID=A0A4Y2DYZ8_ARAVE|nr:hypothetical protein AVEN_224096-1 [Araneus ventricosus]